MPSYVPPHRRSPTAGEASLDDKPLSGEATKTSSPPSTSVRPSAAGGSRGSWDNGRGEGRVGSQGRSRGGWYNGRGSRGGFSSEHSYNHSDLFTPKELSNHFWGKEIPLSSTFHASAEQPSQISFLLLFHTANPRWQTDRIIFAKSKLELLPEYAAKKAERGPWDTPEIRAEMKTKEVPTEEAGHDQKPDGGAEKSPDEKSGEENVLEPGDVASSTGKAQEETVSSNSPKRAPPSQTTTPPASPSTNAPVYHSIPPIDYCPEPHKPIAVFAGRKFGGYSNGAFQFVGWFKVERINILAPHSAELVRMQEQKWKGRQRQTEGWKFALSQEWAVAKFRRLQDDEAPPPLAIQKLPEPEVQQGETQPTKGVTEMLEEMRLKDGLSETVNTEEVAAEKDVSHSNNGGGSSATAADKTEDQENMPPT